MNKINGNISKDLHTILSQTFYYGFISRPCW